MLKLEKIEKSYIMWWKEVKILKWIDLSVKEGEFLCIMGPSGSGKSTLMNIIGLLDVPTKWAYILDWVRFQDLNSKQQSQVRWKKIGFIFQWYNLIPRLTVFEQVSLPLMYQWISSYERKERVLQALERVWLSQKIHNKPNELSWGQQQRVSIARALVINPSIILADEPTGALDSKTGIEILEILKQLHSEWKTIILITHSEEISLYAEKTIILKDGEIVEEKIVTKRPKK